MYNLSHQDIPGKDYSSLQCKIQSQIVYKGHYILCHEIKSLHSCTTITTSSYSVVLSDLICSCKNVLWVFNCSLFSENWKMCHTRDDTQTGFCKNIAETVLSKP